MGIFCTDENLSSRMKTFPSIIDSYDELWILYFLRIYLFYDNISSWCLGHVFFTVSKGPSLEKMVGTNGKVGPNPRLVSIEYT